MPNITFGKKTDFLFMMMNLIIHDFLHDFNASKMVARLSKISSHIQQIPQFMGISSGSVTEPASQSSESQSQKGGGGTKRPAQSSPDNSRSASASSSASAFELEVDTIIDPAELRNYEHFGFAETGTDLHVFLQYLTPNLEEFRDFVQIHTFLRTYVGPMTRSKVRLIQLVKEFVQETKLYALGLSGKGAHKRNLIRGGREKTQGTSLRLLHSKSHDNLPGKPGHKSTRSKSKSRSRSRSRSRSASKTKKLAIAIVDKSSPKKRSRQDAALDFLLIGIHSAIQSTSDKRMQRYFRFMGQLLMNYSHIGDADSSKNATKESAAYSAFTAFNLPQIEDFLVFFLFLDHIPGTKSDMRNPLVLSNLMLKYHKLHTEDADKLKQMRKEFHKMSTKSLPKKTMKGGAPLNEYIETLEGNPVFKQIIEYLETPEATKESAILSTKSSVYAIMSGVLADEELRVFFKAKKLETAKIAVEEAEKRYNSARERQKATTKTAFAKAIVDLMVENIYNTLLSERRKAQAAIRSTDPADFDGKLTPEQTNTVQQISVLIASGGLDLILAEDRDPLVLSSSTELETVLLQDQYRIINDIAGKLRGFSTLDTNIREAFTRYALKKSPNQVINNNADLKTFIKSASQKPRIINNAATGVLKDLFSDAELDKMIVCPTSSICDAMGSTGSCSGNELSKRIKPELAEFHDMDFQLLYTGSEDSAGDNYTGRTVLLPKTGKPKTVKVVYSVLCNNFCLPHAEIDIDISAPHVLTLSANNTFKTVINKILFIWSRIFGSATGFAEKDYWDSLKRPDLYVDLATVSTQKGVGDFYQEVNSAAQYGGYKTSPEIEGLRDNLRVGMQGDQPSGVRGGKMVLDGRVDKPDTSGLKDQCLVGYAGDTPGTTIMISRYPITKTAVLPGKPAAKKAKN